MLLSYHMFYVNCGMIAEHLSASAKSASHLSSQTYEGEVDLGFISGNAQTPQPWPWGNAQNPQHVKGVAVAVRVSCLSQLY